jgi:hypothetical protein
VLTKGFAGHGVTAAIANRSKKDVAGFLFVANFWSGGLRGCITA